MYRDILPLPALSVAENGADRVCYLELASSTSSTDGARPPRKRMGNVCTNAARAMAHDGKEKLKKKEEETTEQRRATTAIGANPLFVMQAWRWWWENLGAARATHAADGAIESAGTPPTPRRSSRIRRLCAKMLSSFPTFSFFASFFSTCMAPHFSCLYTRANAVSGV